MRQLFIIIIGVLFVAQSVEAGCPQANSLIQQQGLVAAMPVYEKCALQDNDDETQYYLGQVYETGRSGVKPNKQRALLFYHLAAEAGHAEAQVSLAKLLTALDEQDETRAEIADYLKKIQGMLQKNTLSSFRGELLHPYALLMLAAEKPESKWFYNSSVLRSEQASRALKSYPITPDKKETALQAATAWKQRKMLEKAQNVLSVDEYRQFYNAMYPQKGRSDDFTRSRLLQKLKEKITEEK